MKLDYRYLVVAFLSSLALLFDRFMYPYFNIQGISYLEIGIIDAIFSISTMIVLYYYGNIADKIGRRKMLAVLSAYYALFPLLYLSVSNFISGVLFRVLDSPSYPRFPIELAYFHDLAPKYKKAIFFGLVTAALAFGGIAAPIIGGYLIDHYGFVVLAYASFAFGLVFAAIVFLLPDPYRKKLKKVSIKRMNFSILKKNRFLKAISVFYFLTGISFVLVWIWIPFLSMQATDSYGVIGVIMAAGGLFAAFGRIFFGHFENRYGRVGAFIIAGILSSLSMVFLGISKTVLALLASSLLGSFSGSIRDPAEQSLLSDNIEESERGETFCAFEFLSRAGVVVGAVLGGVVVTFLNTSSAFLLAAAIEASGIAVFVLALRFYASPR